MEFETELEYLTTTRECLSSLGIPSNIGGPLSSQMADESTVSRLPKLPEGTIGFMVPKTYWVIRNDDLKLMETLWTAVGAATTGIIRYCDPD